MVVLPRSPRDIERKTSGFILLSITPVMVSNIRAGNRLMLHKYGRSQYHTEQVHSLCPKPRYLRAFYWRRVVQPWKRSIADLTIALHVNVVGGITQKTVTQKSLFPFRRSCESHSWKPGMSGIQCYAPELSLILICLDTVTVQVPNFCRASLYKSSGYMTPNSSFDSDITATLLYIIHVANVDSWDHA